MSWSLSDCAVITTLSRCMCGEVHLWRSSLGCLVAGISSHSGDLRAHSTRSGKQREMVLPLVSVYVCALLCIRVFCVCLSLYVHGICAWGFLSRPLICLFCMRLFEYSCGLEWLRSPRRGHAEPVNLSQIFYLASLSGSILSLGDTVENVSPCVWSSP